MSAKLHLGDESKIQMPDIFAGVDLQGLRQAQGGPRNSAPIIGEDYRQVRLAAITQRSPIQTRAPFDPEHDEDDLALVASLESEGQRQPVTLAEIEGASPIEYRLLDGHRRVDALLHLKRETVKAVITRPGTLEADVITLTAHVRKNLTPVEMAQAVVRMKERHGLTLDQIARKTGIARRRLTEMASLMRADPALQQVTENGRLTAEVAFTLSQAPREHQAELARIAADAALKSPVAGRLVERVTTTGESPESAALALGISPRGSTETAGPADAGPKEPAQTVVTSVTPTKRGKRSQRPRGISVQAAAAVLGDLFPEMDPASLRKLAGSASEQNASVNVLKLAALLALGGHHLETVVNDASTDAGTSIGKKILLMLDSYAGICLQKDRLSQGQRLMLAGLAKKMTEVVSCCDEGR